MWRQDFRHASLRSSMLSCAVREDSATAPVDSLSKVTFHMVSAAFEGKTGSVAPERSRKRVKWSLNEGDLHLRWLLVIRRSSVLASRYQMLEELSDKCVPGKHGESYCQLYSGGHLQPQLMASTHNCGSYTMT